MHKPSLALWKRITRDLSALRIPFDFTLKLKVYNKRTWGRYNPNNKTVHVYLNGRTYTNVFKTLLHEVVHHTMWSDPSFTRIRGVMHSPRFWRMYNEYEELYERSVLLEKEKDDS